MTGPAAPAGVWAAIPTPFDGDDRIDEGVLRENLGRLHAAGVHGVYTTDADGEFYALELAEFRRLVDIVADETAQLGLPAQVGVTWTNTAGIVDRLRHCVDRGIGAAHVAYPYFMPLTADECRRFWRDVAAAVPERFGLIHYNSARCAPAATGADYAELAGQIPNLVGTKQPTSDFPTFLAVQSAAPRLAHFTSEHSYTPFSLFGAQGIYSWFANVNPTYLLDWHEDMRQQRWDAARHRQQRMHAFIDAMRPLLAAGHQHAVVSKAVASVSPFLVPAVATRRPYLPAAPATVDGFRRTVADRFADLLCGSPAGEQPFVEVN